MIDRHRRDAAPIVDPGLDQALIILRAEIRRRLQIDLGLQDKARRRHGPHQFIKRRLGFRRQFRVRLGPEILNDDFLDMSVAGVKIGNGNQTVETLGAGFSDADQDSGGEGDRQFAGHANIFEPDGGMFVGRAVMHLSFFAQPCARGLQHDALAHRDIT